MTRYATHYDRIAELQARIREDHTAWLDRQEHRQRRDAMLRELREADPAAWRDMVVELAEETYRRAGVFGG